VIDRLPAGGVAVLGRMTAAVYRQPIAHESCQVVGWARERDGRKTRGGSALYAADGELMAAARTVWISL